MSDPTAIPNLQPTSAAEGSVWLNRVQEVLKGMDLVPQIDNDGDIAVEVNDQRLFVRVTEGDLVLLRVFGQWSITDDIPGGIRPLDAANTVNMQMNFVKLLISQQVLIVSADHIVTEDLPLEVTLGSSMQAILQATQMWHAAVTSDEEAPA